MLVRGTVVEACSTGLGWGARFGCQHSAAGPLSVCFTLVRTIAEQRQRP